MWPAAINAATIDETTKFDATDFRNKLPRFSEENRRSNQAIVDVIRKFAAQKNVTAAQIAIAWLLAQKPWIVPIPGTTKLHRLKENIDALAIELTPEELSEISGASADVTVHGQRYPTEVDKMTRR